MGIRQLTFGRHRQYESTVSRRHQSNSFSRSRGRHGRESALVPSLAFIPSYYLLGKPASSTEVKFSRMRLPRHPTARCSQGSYDRVEDSQELGVDFCDFLKAGNP